MATDALFIPLNPDTWNYQGPVSGAPEFHAHPAWGIEHYHVDLCRTPHVHIPEIVWGPAVVIDPQPH